MLDSGILVEKYGQFEYIGQWDISGEIWIYWILGYQWRNMDILNILDTGILMEKYGYIEYFGYWDISGKIWIY